jgi:hypothetical protein
MEPIYLRFGKREPKPKSEPRLPVAFDAFDVASWIIIEVTIARSISQPFT